MSETIEIDVNRYFQVKTNEYGYSQYIMIGNDKELWAEIKKQNVQLRVKEQECEELKKEKMKLIDKSIEQKCKIRELIDENATKEVVYKINGKCVKTVANKVKEISEIIAGKNCKWSRYKRALAEIEEIVSGTYYETEQTVRFKMQDIQDIINKTKQQ